MKKQFNLEKNALQRMFHDSALASTLVGTYKITLKYHDQDDQNQKH